MITLLYVENSLLHCRLLYFHHSTSLDEGHWFLYQFVNSVFGNLSLIFTFGALRHCLTLCGVVHHRHKTANLYRRDMNDISTLSILSCTELETPYTNYINKV